MQEPKIIRTFASAIENETSFAIKDEGAIAQLVEHRTENPCVPGSNPGGTTSSFHQTCFSFGESRSFVFNADYIYHTFYTLLYI